MTIRQLNQEILSLNRKLEESEQRAATLQEQYDELVDRYMQAMNYLAWKETER